MLLATQIDEESDGERSITATEIEEVPPAEDASDRPAAVTLPERCDEVLATLPYLPPESPDQAESQGFDLERALSQVILEEYPEEPLGRLEPLRETRSAEAPLTLTVAPCARAGRSITDSESWDRFWRQLQFRGWKIDTGPRGDRYWLPPGVERRPPWQNRKDYFDSKLQVVRHLRDEGNMVVEVGADDTSRAAPKAAKVPKAAPKAPEEHKEAVPKSAATKASAGPKKRPPPAPAAPESRKAAKSGPRSEWARVWAELQQSGWRLEEVGQRKDRYYLPPGVSRGPGKKNRVDYFDSRKLVLSHLEQLRQKSGRSRGSGAVLKRPSAAVKS